MEAFKNSTNQCCQYLPIRTVQQNSNIHITNSNSNSSNISKLDSKM